MPKPSPIEGKQKTNAFENNSFFFSSETNPRNLTFFGAIFSNFSF